MVYSKKQKSKSINTCLWSMRNQDAHQQNSSRFGFFNGFHLCQRRGAVLMQSMHWNATNFCILSMSQKQENMHFFIYMESKWNDTRIAVSYTYYSEHQKQRVVKKTNTQEARKVTLNIKLCSSSLPLFVCFEIDKFRCFSKGFPNAWWGIKMS